MEITNFLINNRVIFHPRISPSGRPNFTNYHGCSFTLILDRNILVPILDLVQMGTLNDTHKLKLISCLLFWSDFNGISLTSGFALMEHSHFQGESTEASNQHNVFQSIFKQYSPQDWLDLAMGNISSIPKLDHLTAGETNYFVDNEHYKLNYLQVLKLCQLYFQNELSTSGKMREFHQWSYEHALIGMYSTFYAMMFFSLKTKLAGHIHKSSIEELYSKCKNVAWDLTYLSFWSTLYWDDNNMKKIYLLATRDREVKNLFILVNTDQKDAYRKAVGHQEGDRIKKELESIYIPRPKRTFEDETLKKKILEEENQLKNLMIENAI